MVNCDLMVTLSCFESWSVSKKIQFTNLKGVDNSDRKNVPNWMMKEQKSKWSIHFIRQIS